MITAEDVVADARTYLGAPYKLGGRSPEAFDCVGLALLVANDFGANWQFEMPGIDPDSSIAWENVNRALQEFRLQQIEVTDSRIGDLVIVRRPLGGAWTVKIISELGGMASFFGVSKFIHFRDPTFLQESGITVDDMIGIRRELKCDMQTFVKRLWKFYRYPFVETA